MALTAFLFAATLSACGSSSVAATPSVTSTPPAVPSPTAASRSCPAAATVDAALGVTLPKPVGVAGSGGTQLPAGASATICEYHAQTYNVIIEIITNIDPSFITQFSSRFPVA